MTDSTIKVVYEKKLWSHTAAQFSAPESEELEILRRRYSSAPVLILPLSSGRFAILGVDRQLRTILDAAPTDSEIREWSASLSSRVKLESAFLGEPTDRALARDLRRERLAHDEPAEPRAPVAADW